MTNDLGEAIVRPPKRPRGELARRDRVAGDVQRERRQRGAQRRSREHERRGRDDQRQAAAA